MMKNMIIVGHMKHYSCNFADASGVLLRRKLGQTWTSWPKLIQATKR